MYNTLLIKQQLCNRSLITQHIDNSEAIDAYNHPIYTQRQAIAPEADIILAVHALRTKLSEDGGDTNIQWIKAHPDDKCKTSDLSPPSQLNSPALRIRCANEDSDASSGDGPPELVSCSADDGDM